MGSHQCVLVLVSITLALLLSIRYVSFVGLITEAEPKLIVRPSGLKYFDVAIGDGESPVNGEKVSVHYIHYFAPPGENVTAANYGRFLCPSDRAASLS